MGDEDTISAVAVPDDEDEKEKPRPVDKPPAPVMPAPVPAIRPGPAQPMAPPIVASPPPQVAAPSDLGGSVAAGPQNKGFAAIDRLSPIQQQNPFNMLMAKEENIHNPILRVLAKTATGIGRGAETLAPDYSKVEEQRQQAAAAPGEASQRAAQTENLSADAAEKRAETARLAAGVPKLTGEVYSDGQGGFMQLDENSGKMVTVSPPGQSPQTGVAPTGGQSGGFAAPPAGPAGPQAPAAGPQNAPPAFTKPQEPVRPTAGEAAELSPVGEAGAKDVNARIAGMPGVDASKFVVKPTDSQKQADKIEAEALSEGNSIRGAKAQTDAASRGAEAQERANKQADAKPVIATDPKSGRKIITSMGDAEKNGYQERNGGPGEYAYNNAQSTATNIDLMDQALRQFHENVSDIDALTQKDKNILQEFLNSREMNPPGGALNYISRVHWAVGHLLIPSSPRRPKRSLSLRRIS